MEYVWAIVLPLLAAAILSFYFMLHRRKLVQELVWAQLNGKSINSFFIHF